MTRQDLTGKRVTVVGAGRSGVAAAKLLARHGVEAFVTERGAEDPVAVASLNDAGIPFEYGGHSNRALDADIVVKSPGIPDTAPLIEQFVADGKRIYSEIEVASWFCDAPITAITGSNGKTTTTALIGHVLATAERPHIVAGNIGEPFSNHADGLQASDVAVLEISSFQLDHIDTFRPRVGVLLNITPDHLDRYGNDFGRYANAKFRLFENQGEGDCLVYNADDPVVSARVERGVPAGLKRLAISLNGEVGEGAFIFGRDIVTRFNDNEEVLMPYEELAFRGPHNLYNSLAASMAARFLEVSNEPLRESMRTFEGIPHRLEFIRERNGVRYVNDSKATNVNAVWYALESFSEPVILIAGGIDKGNDYEEIAALVKNKVRGLITIGSAAERIEESLGDLVDFAVRAGSMDEAVRVAHGMAKPGEIVLLSPACASFDMFRNFEDRGDAFRHAVMAL